MTGIEFALYRAARQLMSDEQLRIAEKLAHMADRGDRKAAETLRWLTIQTITGYDAGEHTLS